MRDDILSIVVDTTLAIERKITLFNRFLAKEHELNSFLKTDFENEPFLIIESENDIIAEINIQDFIISGLNDQFIKKTGKNLSTPELAQFVDVNGKLAGLAKLRSEEKRIVEEISELRKINSELMNTVKKELLEDAVELKRMRELEIVISKESRLFF